MDTRLLDFAEFQRLLPKSKITEAVFDEYNTTAEISVINSIVHPVSNLNPLGLEIVRKAIALWIEFFDEVGGVHGDNIASQTINGVSTTFANTGSVDGAGVRRSHVALKLLENYGLTSKAN